MILPANIIAANKLAEIKISFAVTDELMQWADLIIWQRQYKPNLLEFAKKYRDLGKKQIFEIDDDLWSLTPANPAYIHYPHAILKQLNEFISVCDAVTCSAEPLKQELVKKFKKPTYVLPNSILSNYIIPPNKIENEIRIGWVGSAHHHDDLKYAIHAIKDVHNKYKNTKLVFMGGTIDKYLDMFDRSRTEFHQWVDFKQYYDKLNSLNLHIGLAPIEDNKFNISKSSLRFLEMTACGAATIASDVYPYSNTIENGKDGIIVKKNRHLEWLKALSSLVENPNKITELCSNAQIKLKDKFDYYKNICMWINTYSEVLGDYKRIEVSSEIKATEPPKTFYDNWIESNEPSKDELITQKNTKFNYAPKISIVCPTYNTKKEFLIEMLESVVSQTYSNFELCIVDGNSERYVKDILLSYASIDSRIKVKLLKENKGISNNSNIALLMCNGDYICFVDHDDTLSPFALCEIVKSINNDKNLDFIYSDEDKLLENGKRGNPHFKPDFSPETLLSYNYICHLSVYRKEFLDKLGALNSEFDGAQDYDLILCASRNTNKIYHIPKILYHWRMSHTSTASDSNNKSNIIDNSTKVLTKHINAINYKGIIKKGLLSDTYTINNSLNEKVSIIIPNKNSYTLLSTCANSILDKTKYKNYEILIIENGSTDSNIFDYYKDLENKYSNVKIIKWETTKFNFSTINNFAVDYATGDYVLFLNNDTEVINEDWLSSMLDYAVIDGVGIVGAKLYYPNNTIQHAGVFMWFGQLADHSFKNYRRDAIGYMGRLMISQNLSAVTGACLLIKKDIFNDIGKFDEKFELAFGDVDLCAKVIDKGYRVVWTPFAELYHHESVTRGYEDTPEKIKRFNNEVNYFRSKWGDFNKVDKYYNNIHILKGMFGENTYAFGNR